MTAKGSSSGAAGLTIQLLILVYAGCAEVPPATTSPAPVVEAEPMPMAAAPAPTTSTPSSPIPPVPVPARKPDPEPPAARPSPPVEPPLADSASEQRWRGQAEELMKAGRWAEAAARWEILTLLRPQQGDYASSLAKTQGRARSEARDNLAAATEARKRGDLQHAAMLCLKALIADPQSTEAAHALRELEREQAHRLYFNHAAIGVRPTRAAHAPYSADRQELDTGVMLLHQGDYGASVQSLQNYVKRDPRDDMGKRALRDAYAALGKQRIEQGKKEEGLSYLEKARATKSNGSTSLDSAVQAARKDLARDYYEQGLRMQRTDLDAAIRLWERSLEYDSTNAQARIRLDQAQRMQKNLQAIPGASSKP